MGFPRLAAGFSEKKRNITEVGNECNVLVKRNANSYLILFINLWIVDLIKY